MAKAKQITEHEWLQAILVMLNTALDTWEPLDGQAAVDMPPDTADGAAVYDKVSELFFKVASARDKVAGVLSRWRDDDESGE